MTLSREELSRLAVAQAVYKAMGEQLSTRGGAHGADNVRTRADAELRSMFEESGTDRVSLMVNGSKVGTLSARLTKPTSRDWFACDNVAELVAWLRGDDGEAALTRLAESLGGDIAADSVAHEGELPPGCSPHHDELPSGGWGGTTLRVDVAKVRDALGEGLPAAVAGLISGEVE